MLPPGTALQQGNYVIDALIEAAPNGNLYLGTHVVAGLPVYLQVTPLAASITADDKTALVDCLQGLSFAAESPLPTPFHLFLEDDHLLCWVVGKAVGMPWPLGCPHTPLPPKQALNTVRAVAAGFLWLSSKGLSNVDLSPNRLWALKRGDRIVLTGLPQTQIAYANEGDAAPRPSAVQSLARLLYSLLLGEVPPVIEAETLVQLLKDRQPDLSPLILQAVGQGENTPPTAFSTPADISTGVRQWLGTLPDTPASVQQVPPTQQSASTQLAPQNRQNRWPVYSALGATALLAALAGSAAATLWRLNTDAVPGAIQFDPSQSFPNQADWPGDNPDVNFDTPYVSEQQSPFKERQADWLTPEQEPNLLTQPRRSPAEPVEPAVFPDSAADDDSEAAATTETSLELVEEVPVSVPLEGGGDLREESVEVAPDGTVDSAQEAGSLDPKVVPDWTIAPDGPPDTQVDSPTSDPTTKEIFSTVPESVAEPTTDQTTSETGPVLAPAAPGTALEPQSPVAPPIAPPRSEG